jgi:hypothetical protein
LVHQVVLAVVEEITKLVVLEQQDKVTLEGLVVLEITQVVEAVQEQLVAQHQAQQVVLVVQDCLPHTLEVLLLMQAAVAVVLGVMPVA